MTATTLIDDRNLEIQKRGRRKTTLTIVRFVTIIRYYLQPLSQPLVVVVVVAHFHYWNWNSCRILIFFPKNSQHKHMNREQCGNRSPLGWAEWTDVRACHCASVRCRNNRAQWVAKQSETKNSNYDLVSASQQFCFFLFCGSSQWIVYVWKRDMCVLWWPGNLAAKEI